MATSPSKPLVVIAAGNSLTAIHFEQTLHGSFDVLSLPNPDRITLTLREQQPLQPDPTMLGDAPEHPVDLVIIECGADCDSAVAALQDLKGSHEFHTIPVILVGEQEDTASELLALEHGAADYWSMPLTETVLLARVSLHTQLSRNIKRLNRYSMTDDVTGATSRRRFEEALLMEWRRAVREKTWLSLAFIAMDGIETYAERLGRESVEECMHMLAVALGTCLRRPADVLSRVSDDMFAALLPATGPQGATAVAQQMLGAVSGLQLVFPGSVARLQLDEYVSISVGMASAAPDSPSGYDRFAQSVYNSLGLAMAEGPWGVRHSPME